MNPILIGFIVLSILATSSTFVFKDSLTNINNGSSDTPSMEEIVVEKDIDIKTNEDLEIVQGTIKYVTFARSEEDKALIKAIENGQLDVVKELIKAGANINIWGNDRITLLELAASNGNFGIVQELIKAGASVNDSSLLFGIDYIDIVKELIKAGANINYANISGSPLTKAAERGHLEAVKELIKAGADVNFRDMREITALMYATQNGHLEIVQELIKAGAK